MSLNRYGSGKAYYLGTSLSEEGEKAVYAHILSKAGVKPFPFAREEGIEIIKRVSQTACCYFVFNMTEEEKEIEFFGTGTEIFSGNAVSGKMKIPAKEVFLIKTAGQK